MVMTHKIKMDLSRNGNPPFVDVVRLHKPDGNVSNYDTISYYDYYAYCE